MKNIIIRCLFGMSIVATSGCTTVMTKGNVAENSDTLVEISTKHSAIFRVFYVAEEKDNLISAGKSEKIESLVRKILSESKNAKAFTFETFNPENISFEKITKNSLEEKLSNGSAQLDNNITIDTYQYYKYEGRHPTWLYPVFLMTGVSMVTLGIIPAYIPRKLHMKSLVRNKRGVVIQEFDLDASASQWFGTLLFLFKGSRKIKKGSELTDEFEERVIRTHLNEIFSSDVFDYANDR